MSHELVRLRQSILSEPQLITSEGLVGVLEFLDARNFKDELKLIELQQKMRAENPMAFIDSPEVNRNIRYSKSGAIAQVNISGALSHKATAMEALCGARSYQTIISDFQELAQDENVKTVVMNVDSGGGAATGMFDAAKEIKALMKDKKLIAFVDSMAASAAYGLACVADEIVATSDAKLGSIGVILPLMNYKEKLDKDGIKFTPIYAGEHKALGHPALEMSDTDKELLQSRVDALFEMFTGLVSENRNLTHEAIVDLKALVFMGNEAVDKGLADKVMSVSEFNKYLGGMMSNLDVTNVEETVVGADAAPEQVEAATGVDLKAFEEMQAQMKEMQSLLQMKQDDLEKAQAVLQAKAEQETADKLAGFEAKAEAWATFGVDAKVFAQAAMNADQEFVALVVEALDKANAQVDDAVLVEHGHAVEGTGTLTESDSVKALLEQKYLKAK